MQDLDNICRSILRSILNGFEEYAEIARDMGAGSYKTVKSHIEKHLLPKKLVTIEKKKRGVRTYDVMGLTEEGRALAMKIKGE
jgi:hypothetical protein